MWFSLPLAHLYWMTACRGESALCVAVEGGGGDVGGVGCRVQGEGCRVRG